MFLIDVGELFFQSHSKVWSHLALSALFWPCFACLVKSLSGPQRTKEKAD